MKSGHASGFSGGRWGPQNTPVARSASRLRKPEACATGCTSIFFAYALLAFIDRNTYYRAMNPSL